MANNLAQKYLDFLLQAKDVVPYLHRTQPDAAEKIMQEGFWHRSIFGTTADVGVRSLDNLEFFLRMHEGRTQAFGPCTVVLGIGHDVYKKYSALYSKIIADFNQQVSQYGERGAANLTKDCVQNMLTDVPPRKDYFHDEVFLLPLHFVKGFFNESEGVIAQNMIYDPHYDSPVFQQNIDALARVYQTQLEVIKTEHQKRLQDAKKNLSPIVVLSNSRHDDVW